MRLVLGMKSELQRLQRRIRPMKAVVRHLMDDEQIGHDMKVYLEDVLDHVVRGLEEIGGCIEMCDSTKEEFKSLRVRTDGRRGGGWRMYVRVHQWLGNFPDNVVRGLVGGGYTERDVARGRVFGYGYVLHTFLPPTLLSSLNEFNVFAFIIPPS